MRIKAIILDFDGTLCPTSSINPFDTESNSLIPAHLEDTFYAVSNVISICMLKQRFLLFI